MTETEHATVVQRWLDAGLVMMLFESGQAQLPGRSDGRSRSRSSAKR